MLNRAKAPGYARRQGGSHPGEPAVTVGGPPLTTAEPAPVLTDWRAGVGVAA